MLSQPVVPHAARRVALVMAATSIPVTAFALAPTYQPAAIRLGGHVANPALWRAPVEWGALNTRLLGWAALPAGWDGRGGYAPPREVVNAALDVAVALQAANVPAPEPFVAGDGEVGFRWRRGGRVASVCFLDDGCIVAYVPSEDGREPFRLDTAVADLDNHDELVDRLTRFA